MTEDESHILIGKVDGKIEVFVGGNPVTLGEASDKITDMSVSSDGSVLVTGSIDKSIRVYRFSGGNFLHDHSIAMSIEINQVYITNDLSRIFFGGEANAFFILEENGGVYSTFHQIPLSIYNTKILHMVVSEDYEDIVLSGSGSDIYV